jgi:hypothetical protein
MIALPNWLDDFLSSRGFWAKHMGLKLGAIGNILEGHIENLGINVFGRRNFMQPMGRPKHTLNVPCIFSF